MKKFSTCGIVLVLVLGAILFSTTLASAAPTHNNVQRAHMNPLDCTPNQYHVIESVNIFDLQNINEKLGVVALYIDGCGWVQARCFAYNKNESINHCELRDAGTRNTVVAAPTFVHGTYNGTYHYKTNGACIYAYGVIQDSSQGYWGENSTRCSDGAYY